MSVIRATAVLLAVSFAAFPLACSATNDGAVTGTQADTAVQCDLSGAWAVRIAQPVKWAGSFVLQAGTGTITKWLKINRTQTGTTISDSAMICGLTLADYQAVAAFGSEKYGIRVPDEVFDNGLLPLFPLNATVSGTTVGSTYTTSTIATLLGTTMANPTTDPWPTNAAALAAVDIDNDHKPGLTATAAPGAGFANPPVNPFRTARADRVYIAVREVLTSTGTLTSCNEVVGTGKIATINNKPAIDSHVLGCRRVDGTECASSEFKLLDSVSPTYAPSGDSTVHMLKIADTTTCASIRALDFDGVSPDAGTTP